MLDTEEHVIAATAANRPAAIGGRLFAPRFDRCGGAGVARAGQASVVETDLDRATLDRPSGICLTSTVRGMWSVAMVAERALAIGPAMRALQAHGHALGLPPEGVA